MSFLCRPRSTTMVFFDKPRDGITAQREGDDLPLCRGRMIEEWELVDMAGMQKQQMG